MADSERKSLGNMLDEAIRRDGPARKRVGASGPYYAKPGDALRDPVVVEAVKRADDLAVRLKLVEEG